MSGSQISWADLVGLSPEAAAALLVHRLERDEPEGDSELLDRWLAASEDNRIAWTRARDAWDSFDGWAGDSTLAAMRAVAVAASFAARRPRWPALAQAAAVLAIVTGASVLSLHLYRGGSGGPAAQVAAIDRFGLPDFVVEGPSYRMVTLPDGTRATLASGTVLDLAFTPTSRLARLERGQARFVVARDGRRPFRVGAGEQLISDIGTTFSVEQHGTQTKIHLVEGKVMVVAGSDLANPPASEGVTLEPGQSYEAGPDGGRVIAAPAEAPTNAGRPERLSFSNEPLERAIARMNEGSPVKITGDARIAQYRISGSFRARDAARFAHSVAVLYPIRIRKQPDGSLLLLPKNAK